LLEAVSQPLSAVDVARQDGFPFTAAVVLVGTNDALQPHKRSNNKENGETSIALTAVHIERIHKRLHRDGRIPLTLVLSVPPMHAIPPIQALRNALNARLREFADASHGRHLFVDLESALRRSNASAAEVAHRFADDVHLTPHGYNELASVVGDALLAGGAAACPLFDAAGMAQRLRVTSLRDSERPLCYADVG
jgi:lysophospholipase L1-like esterase